MTPASLLAFVVGALLLFVLSIASASSGQAIDPDSVSDPEPASNPASVSDPDPGLESDPDPESEPDPDPESDPDPDPDPESDPDSGPDSDPDSDLVSDPDSDPTPDLDPESEPWEFRRMRWFPPRVYAGGVFVLPRITFSDRRGWGFGGDVRYYFHWPECSETTPQSELELDGRLTSKSQGDIAFSATFHTSPDFHFKAKIEHETLVERYYGIGPDTPESLEEEYKPQDTRAYVEFFRAVHGNVRLGARAEVRRFLFLDRENDGALVTEPIQGAEKGVTSGAGLILDWDRRRGRAHSLSGTYVQGFALFFDEVFGSDHDFNNYHLDARAYIPAGRQSLIGLQGFLYAAKGRPPFWHFAELGGRAHTRGYRRGRYRDRVLAAGQIEWRQHLFWRLGWAGFAGIAAVGDTTPELRADNIHPSFGGGPRVLLSRSSKRLYARFDVGFGGESVQYYLSLGEAF